MNPYGFFVAVLFLPLAMRDGFDVGGKNIGFAGRSDLKLDGYLVRLSLGVGEPIPWGGCHNPTQESKGLSLAEDSAAYSRTCPSLSNKIARRVPAPPGSR